MKTRGSGLSRREFLRVSAGGIVGLAGFSLLSACGAPEATPTTAKPAPAAPGAPTPAAKPEEPKIGRQLIGKLEGPEFITDPTKFPKKFSEAPMLADLVKAGKLPPVEKRIPEDPLVIKPLHQIGKYGGTWRRGFTGPADAAVRGIDPREGGHGEGDAAA